MLISLINHNYPLKANNKLSFGVNMQAEPPYDYQRFGLNGEVPDTFIMETIQNYLPDPQSKKILDVASGDGRNALAVAKKGYSVDCMEISYEGNKICNKMARSRKVKSKINTTFGNILYEMNKENEYDLVYMAHLTQHLNSKDMTIAMHNVHKTLKNNGIVIFDALVKKGSSQIRSTILDEINGDAFFEEKALLKIAEKAGFKLEETAIFKEDKNRHRRASYENYWIDNNPDTVLKWFVFRRK